MDPLANLEEQQLLIEASKSRELTDDERQRLYDLTEAMQEWAAKGGFTSNTEEEAGVLYAPNGVKIAGPLEAVQGVADIINRGVKRDADGTFEFEYAGETNLDWDSQATVLDADGRRQFLDEEGNLWAESDLVLK